MVCLSLREMKLKIYKITRGGSKVNCFITGKRADLLYYSKMLTDILSPSFLMLLRYTTRIKATTKCFFLFVFRFHPVTSFTSVVTGYHPLICVSVWVVLSLRFAIESIIYNVFARNWKYNLSFSGKTAEFREFLEKKSREYFKQ